ncbi:MAG: ABC transporter permease subunit [Clostridia bacterium]|nr:ABC transporter permease subunit [Clostridia bacterium]
MFNIFKYEFKGQLKSMSLWSISNVLLIVMFFALYPNFGEDAALMEKIMENYPEEMLKAFGMSTALPLSSVLGYLVFCFAFLQLMFAIQASQYGFGILSVEEREFTADYLMSKPVSRGKILFAKVSSAIISLFITLVISSIGLIVSIKVFNNGNPYEMKPILILLSSAFFFELTFLTIGLTVSVILRRIRNVLSFSLGLAFGTYIMNAVRAILDGKLLGYLTPFYHFDPAYILVHSAYDGKVVLISFGMIIIGSITTVLLYLKRDIYAL